MNTRQELRDRLTAIGQALAATGQALALLGLGSAGLETDRLDGYSDLDFFVIATPGSKNRFLSTIDWLTAVSPVAFYFLNTADGYKALFADGIFCECAVFEPHELRQIPLSSARVIWQADGFDGQIGLPLPQPTAEKSVDWLLGEALTNLYVGLGRFRRGEKLSACRFIQSYAVDRVVELTRFLETPQTGAPDPFDASRRYEQRYPASAPHLSAFMQGYDRSVDSTLAILAFLEAHFAVNPALHARIMQLCEA